MAVNQIEAFEQLQDDARRYRWIRDNAGRSHSPHMDNTWSWELRKMLNGRHRSLDAAIDHAISGIPTARPRES